MRRPVRRSHILTLIDSPFCLPPCGACGHGECRCSGDGAEWGELDGAGFAWRALEPVVLREESAQA